jgi:hypothetical protein
MTFVSLNRFRILTDTTPNASRPLKQVYFKTDHFFFLKNKILQLVLY